MTVVEHNDVEIDRLFNWSKEFELTIGDKTVPVFMRLVGDADINRARVQALRKSAELRKKLRDSDSDERYAFIKDINEFDIENLISLIIVFSMRDLSERASSKLKIRVPKQPRSEAKTEKHEKYQQEIDSYPERRQTELKSLLEKEVELMKKSLEKESKEELYKRYVNTIIDELCEQELLSSFRSWCCYLGTYKNEELTEKLFSSYEEFSNLHSDLKAQFLTEYSTLELYGDDLKKLQRVTQ